VRIYQHPIARFSFPVAAVVFAMLLVWGFATEPTLRGTSLPVAILVIAVFDLPFVLGAIRSLPGGVQCTATELIYRGWFRTRRIPKASIVSVETTAWGTNVVRWRADSGDERSTTLAMLNTGTNGLRILRDLVEAHNERAIHLIREWLRAG
jgi:hypothetical protein